MPIIVRCSGCGGKLGVREEWAGKRVKCPKCSALTQVGDIAKEGPAREQRAPGTRPQTSGASPPPIPESAEKSGDDPLSFALDEVLAKRNRAKVKDSESAERTPGDQKPARRRFATTRVWSVRASASLLAVALIAGAISWYWHKWSRRIDATIEPFSSVEYELLVTGGKTMDDGDYRRARFAAASLRFIEVQGLVAGAREITGTNWRELSDDELRNLCDARNRQAATLHKRYSSTAYFIGCPVFRKIWTPEVIAALLKQYRGCMTENDWHTLDANVWTVLYSPPSERTMRAVRAAQNQYVKDYFCVPKAR